MIQKYIRIISGLENKFAEVFWKSNKAAAKDAS